VARTLPRAEKALVRDRVNFRVGRIMYLALSRDEAEMREIIDGAWRMVVPERLAAALGDVHGY
jgi:hypothetical protein